MEKPLKVLDRLPIAGGVGVAQRILGFCWQSLLISLRAAGCLLRHSLFIVRFGGQGPKLRAKAVSMLERVVCPQPLQRRGISKAKSNLIEK